MADDNDELAMRLARDEKVVSFLAGQVVDKAKKTIMDELRGWGLVIAAILGVLGFTTWASIDPKVDSAVSKEIKEEMKLRDEDLKKARDEWFKEILAVSVDAKDAQRQLETAKRTTDTINKESETTLAKIKEELAKVEAESKRTQLYFVTLRSGPPSSGVNGVEIVFGKLKPGFFAISGTTGEKFGMGLDTPDGGVFTTAFDQACAAKESDTDGDGLISMKEIANAVRKNISVKQEPSFGGDDISLFAVGEDLRERPSRKLHALLIGLSNVDAKAYDGWNGQLKGPEKDLERLSKRLNDDSKRILADKVSIHTLTNTEATGTNILERIKKLKNEVSAGDVVLLHFSGHCSRRNDTSGAAVDGKVKQLGAYDGLIDVDDVAKALTEVGAAHVVMIIDG